MQRCKGCLDIMPQDMLRFRHIESIFLRTGSGWGYEEIRTPTLEYLYLFTAAGTLTPRMLKRVYSFLDWDGWSGERVVLKPDATIPATRYYLEHHGDSPVKRLCYVTNTFIFEETGTKNRERWQCGAELIGAGSPLADAELVIFALDVLDKLGIKNVEVRLSHAGLIRGLLSNLGLDSREQSMIFDQILDGNTAALESMKKDKPETVAALDLMLQHKGSSSGFLKNIRSLFVNAMPQLQPSMDNFTAVLNLLEAHGIRCCIDLTEGKGFEYYTGIIFRMYAGEKNIGGGGRYDQLIGTMGGRDTPAAGFALYMDRLIEQIQRIDPGVSPDKKVLVVIQPETFEKALEITSRMRASGITAVFAFDKTAAPDYGWTLQMQPGQTLVELSNTSNGQLYICQSPAEILARIGGSGHES